jgi:hypothetical protein
VGRVEQIEISVTAVGIISAITGYLLEVPAMTFFGILFGAIGFGFLLARALPEGKSQ